jgi:hypothetical protein
VASVGDYDSIHTDWVGVKFIQPPTNFLVANKQSEHERIRNSNKYHNFLFGYLQCNGFWSRYRAFLEVVG